MTNNHNPASIASFLKCLSILETETYQLYKALSDKTEHPLVKSLLFSVAIDSQKHAALLKGVANSIAPKLEVTPKTAKKE
jgi:rubrerythrin